MIPVLDLTAQYAAIEQNIDAAIKGVLLSGQFVLGRTVRDLEHQIAAYCECRFGIGVASGTDAIRLVLTAMGIGHGDEVITTPFTFVATGNTVSHAGAKPVFIDIDPRTYNLDTALIEAAITPKTKAIIPVHLYGQPAEMEPIIALAERYNLLIIEDCAQAIGARYKGRRVGAMGQAGCLSFYPTKNLGAYGDGGMVVTDDPELAAKVDVLRRQGETKRYYAEVLGFSSRLDAMQAAILDVKLKHLNDWNNARREVASRYEELLAGLPITLPYQAPDSYHVFHQYTIRSPQRDALAAHLHEKGVGTMIYYPVPLHLQPLYKDLDYREGSLPNAERAAKEVLSLPMFPELTGEQQSYIATAIREFYA